jgi:Alpha/beta hydrolase family
MWQIPHFADSHRVISVDLRGHGRSARPIMATTPEHSPTTLPVCRISSDAVPWSRFGHSLGGVVASALAVERASLVQAVARIDLGYLRPDEYRPRIDPPVADLHVDPVATAQTMLGAASYTPASPPNLKSWHMRRIAGMSPLVLREAGTTRCLVGRRRSFIARCQKNSYADADVPCWRSTQRRPVPNWKQPSSPIPVESCGVGWVGPLDAPGTAYRVQLCRLEVDIVTGFARCLMVRELLRASGKPITRRDHSGHCSLGGVRISNRQCGHPPGRLRPLRSRRYGGII